MILHGFRHINDGIKEPPHASMGCQIKFELCEANILMNEEIQKKDADQLYLWMISNLPHGTFVKLCGMILNGNVG